MFPCTHIHVRMTIHALEHIYMFAHIHVRMTIQGPAHIHVHMTILTHIYVFT